MGGDKEEEVGTTQQNIISHIENLGLQIPPEKVQEPSQEVKFLGIWWKGGMTCIPPDTLTSLDQIKMPESKKDLQHALGLLVFWRKHIPDFSIIARPLYDLLKKRAKWEWTVSQEEAMQLLIFEATAHQALGPIHPSDPFQVEWGFATTGLSVHIWQRGPEGPTRPVGFYSRGFKDAEKRYTAWEKGLFVVSLALIEVEEITRQQPIVLRGPFKVIKAVSNGTPPPDGVAQRASVRKWYAQIEHYCNLFSVTEGALKNLAIQETERLDSSQDKPISVIRVAPPFLHDQSVNAWFTDASAKREGKVWQYRAVALHTATDEQIITEGEGSAQVGELIAVWSVFQHEAQTTPPVHIYTDSHAVFKGCIEWLPFWDQNEWEVSLQCPREGASDKYSLDNSIILIFCLVLIFASERQVLVYSCRRTPRDTKNNMNHLIGLVVLFCILPLTCNQKNTEWPWSQATIKHTSTLGHYPKDRLPNLATVVWWYKGITSQ